MRLIDSILNLFKKKSVEIDHKEIVIKPVVKKECVAKRKRREHIYFEVVTLDGAIVCSGFGLKNDIPTKNLDFTYKQMYDFTRGKNYKTNIFLNKYRVKII